MHDPSKVHVGAVQSTSTYPSVVITAKGLCHCFNTSLWIGFKLLPNADPSSSSLTTSISLIRGHVVRNWVNNVPQSSGVIPAGLFVIVEVKNFMLFINYLIIEWCWYSLLGNSSFKEMRECAFFSKISSAVIMNLRLCLYCITGN
jgi:hypothetical protein